MHTRIGKLSAVTDRCNRALWALARIGVVALAACGVAPALAEDAGARIVANGTPGGVPACASCHGEHGEGNADAGFPRLAGLSPPYMREQLKAFANGRRNNPIMTPVAKMLSADEAQAVSAYFSRLPGPVLPMQVTVAAVAGARLAADGRWADGIPGCFSCHGPGGIGVGAAFPPLAGQPASYIIGQLQTWQAGKRPPGPLGLMGVITRRLTSADISALTEWFATSLGGGGK